MSNNAQRKENSAWHYCHSHSGAWQNRCHATLGFSKSEGMRKRLRPRASGLTLVELLVTIGLITMVSSMFLVAYRAAATEASNIRTQGTIRKINEVLMARMQEYESYPVNLIKDPANPYSLAIPEEAKQIVPNTDLNFESKGILIERIRLMILRDIIAQEMPDNIEDIRIVAPVMRRYWTGLAVPPTRGNPSPIFIFTSGSESPRAARIKTRIVQTRPDWRDHISNAELLYLVIEDSTLNGSSAIELFGRSEIGDTDNDGFLEFLDAYRRPIRWLRWPTGFPDTIRFHPDLLDPSMNSEQFRTSALGDPIDSRRADPGHRVPKGPNSFPLHKPGVAVFPLVISGGPDGQMGVRFSFDSAQIQNGDYTFGRYKFVPGFSSTTYVQMPVPYDDGTDTQPPPPFRLILSDPWFPREKPDLRLGAIINAKAFEDDITNYAINGAYQ